MNETRSCLDSAILILVRTRVKTAYQGILIAFELLFSDERAVGLQQGQQEIEGARAKLDRNAVGKQLPPSQQDAETAEFEIRVCLGIQAGTPAASPWPRSGGPTGTTALRDDAGRRYVGHANFHPIAHAIRNPVELMGAIASLTTGGVLERHPKLRAAFLEGTA